ncbi:MAG: N-acetyltransferase [Cyanobacteria bacterium P01_A01_bin.84]
MIIRPETSSDYPEIKQVNILAFGRESEAKLVEKIRNSKGYIPQLSLVAEIEGVIVGYIMLSYINLLEDESILVLALAPVAVLPKFQRQGIGSALIREGIKKADSVGEAMIIVLGEPEFYSRFGFECSLNFGIESPFEVPARFFMVKSLQKYNQSYRGKVVYSEAFDQV